MRSTYIVLDLMQFLGCYTIKTTNCAILQDITYLWYICEMQF